VFSIQIFLVAWRAVFVRGVMTKAPQAGRVKTRWSALTPEEAAELNKCFLRDHNTCNFSAL